MNEEQIKALGNAEFFKLFMDALKQTYTEYCEMQAQKEGLVNYSEPMFEFAMSEFEQRVDGLPKAAVADFLNSVKPHVSMGEQKIWKFDHHVAHEYLAKLDAAGVFN